MPSHWLLSPIVGTGQEGDAYRPAIANRVMAPGDRLEYVIPTNAAGVPVVVDALVAASVAVDSDLIAAPDWICELPALDVPLSGAAKRRAERIAAKHALPPPTRFRELVGPLGRRSSPTFDESQHLATGTLNPSGSFVDDSFTDTASTLLEDHTGETGATWAKHSLSAAGSMVISSANRVYGTAFNTLYYASGVPAGAEYDVDATFHCLSTTSAVSMCVCSRMSTSAQTYYMLRPNGVTWEFYKNVAGTQTSLGSWVDTLAAGDSRATQQQIRDATKSIFIAGVERITTTDNAITDAGRIGLREVQPTHATTMWHVDGVTATDLVADQPQAIRPDADLDTTGWTTTPLFSKVNDESDATVITATASGGTPASTPTTAVRPDATVSNAWTLTGAATAHEAVDDVVTQPTAPTVPGDNLSTSTATAVCEVAVADHTIPSGATVTQTKLWVYAAGGTKRSITVDLRHGSTSLGTATVAAASAAAWHSVTSTAALTQTQLNDLRCRLTCNSTGGGGATAATAYAAYIDVTTSVAAVPGSTSTARLSLAGGGEPATRTLHSLNVRARKTNAGHTGTLRLRLYEGATARSAEYETSALTTSLADYTLALNDVEAAAITSYADLELRVQGYASAGDATVFEAAELWLEAPAATGTIGASAQTLPALTQAAVGARTVPTFTATAAQTLPAVTQAAAGTAAGPAFTGTAAQTLPVVSQAASGTTAVPVFAGTVAQTLPAFTQTAVGSIVPPTVTGSASQALPAVTQAAAGASTQPTFNGTAAQTLPLLTQAAAGSTTVPTFTATGAQSLPALSQAGAGTHTAPTFSGTAAQTLPAVSQVASATSAAPSFVGTSAQTLPALSQAAVGTATVPTFAATADQTLPALTQAATGSHTAPTSGATVAQTLPAVTQTATGATTPPTFTATAQQALSALTQAATGTTAAAGVSGEAAQTLPALQQSATANTVPRFTAVAAQALPALTQTATGGYAPPTFTAVVAQTLPAVTQIALGQPPFTYGGAPGWAYGGDDNPAVTYGSDPVVTYSGDDDPTTTYGGTPAFTYGGR